MRQLNDKLASFMNERCSRWVIETYQQAVMLSHEKGNVYD